MAQITFLITLIPFNMNRINLITYLLIIVGLFSCINTDEPIEPTLQESTSAFLISNPGPGVHNIAKITIKYSSIISKEARDTIRQADYFFTIQQIQPTLCDHVEVWSVIFPPDYNHSEVPGQNGYTKGNFDTTPGIQDQLTFIERMEVNWFGSCQDF